MNRCARLAASSRKIADSSKHIATLSRAKRLRLSLQKSLLAFQELWLASLYSTRRRKVKVCQENPGRLDPFYLSEQENVS